MVERHGYLILRNNQYCLVEAKVSLSKRLH